MTTFGFRNLWHLVTRRCNNYFLPESSRDTSYHFYVDGHHLGFIHPEVLPFILRFPDVFCTRIVPKKRTRINTEDTKEGGEEEGGSSGGVSQTIVELHPRLVTEEERTEAVAVVMLELRDTEDIVTLRGWRNEEYGAFTAGRVQSLFRIERAACSLLGLVKYGVHVNAYTVSGQDGGVYMWISQRALTKPTWPGKLDNMAAGGLCFGITVIECMQKECEEEASVPPSIFQNIKPAGSVSYVLEDERFIQPQVEFCFDLEVPESFRPRNADGEVDGFLLCSIPQVKELICDERFKPNSAMVILDFLFRHGYMDETNSEQGFSKLLDWMHVKIPLET